MFTTEQYLEEALDVMWSYDGDYCDTFAELKECWTHQNLIRARYSLKALTEEDLELSRKGKK